MIADRAGKEQLTQALARREAVREAVPAARCLPRKTLRHQAPPQTARLEWMAWAGLVTGSRPCRNCFRDFLPALVESALDRKNHCIWIVRPTRRGVMRRTEAARLRSTRVRTRRARYLRTAKKWNARWRNSIQSRYSMPLLITRSMSPNASRSPLFRPMHWACETWLWHAARTMRGWFISRRITSSTGISAGLISKPIPPIRWVLTRCQSWRENCMCRLISIGRSSCALPEYLGPERCAPRAAIFPS